MEFQPAEAKKFFSTVRKEMALLATSLPDGIMVKTFEDRMVGLWSSTWLSSELVFVYKALVTILNHFLNTNYLSLWNYLYIFLSHIQDLFSAQIKGPTRTPYEDGLFLFDIQLPNIYPAVPPLFRYLSQCSGRLNPNLYDNGKVCVSLLGTWIGKVSWVWSDCLQCNDALVVDLFRLFMLSLLSYLNIKALFLQHLVCCDWSTGHWEMDQQVQSVASSHLHSRWVGSVQGHRHCAVLLPAAH